MRLSDYDGSSLSYSHGGLSPGTTYYYQVAAINSVGTGAYSSIETATEDEMLSLSTANLSFDPGGGTEPFTIESNVSWTAMSSETELAHDRRLKYRYRERSLSIVATANPDASERTATITVVAGSETRTISVMQGAAAATLSVSPSPLSFAAAREDLTLTITTNEASWTVGSLAPWLTLSESSGTGTADITVTATANPDASERMATITVVAGSETRMVSVTQGAAAATLSVSPSPLSFAAARGTDVDDYDERGGLDDRESCDLADVEVKVQAQGLPILR